MIQIGFVILSHANPHQLRRLCNRLVMMFQGCAIVCHHDFERCPFDTVSFPSNVVFVKPSIRTFWGHISLVHAELAALAMLYDLFEPDWFYLLSGADYPVKAAEQILTELENSTVDAYIDFRLIQRRGSIAEGCLGHEQLANWRYRYLESMLVPELVDLIERIPDISQATALAEASYRSIVVPAERRLPRDLPCYAGDHWLTGNRKVAKVLLTRDRIMEELLEFFHYSAIADEAIYQTRLCNKLNLSLSNQNMRFAKWAVGNEHPKILESDDLPDIWVSGCHFARKFQPDTPVLNEIDAVLGIA